MSTAMPRLHVRRRVDDTESPVSAMLKLNPMAAGLVLFESVMGGETRGRYSFIGMAPDLGTLQRLPRLIPAGIARELAFTGRRMYGDEAKEVGYVNTVYDTHEEMLAAVMELARGIAGKSPLAVHGSKELMNYARDHSVADSLNYVAIWTAATLVGGRDLREGVAAFREKRDASFANLYPVTHGRRPHDD